MPHLSSSDDQRQARVFVDSLRALRARYQPRAQLPRSLDRAPFSFGFVRKRVLRASEMISKTRRQLGLATLDLMEHLHVELRDTYTQLLRSLDTVHRDALAARLEVSEATESLEALTARVSALERGMPASSSALVPLSSAASPQVSDEMYSAFEERFRGSEELIRERAKVYLPLFREAKRNTRSSHAVDIGCGRGELLELLHGEGFDARGVEINAVQAQRCRDRGLDVVVEDGIGYLKSLEANSISVLTGFHVIEHLPFERMIELFREAQRVLEPGGMALFETPNATSLFVVANIFYIDPTHLRPLPPAMLTFFGEACGLTRVECMLVNPQLPSPPTWAGTPQMGQWLQDTYYGPQDCALVGWKGGQ